MEMLSTPTSNIDSIFLDFMTRITKVDELVGIGSRLLAGFRSALESFRRPRLPETSPAVKEIIEANKTEQMKSYVQAGCRHPDIAAQDVIKLSSCLQDLQNNLARVKLLLVELEHFVEDAAGLLKLTHERSRYCQCQESAPGIVNHHLCMIFQHEGEGCHSQGIKVVDHTVMMKIVVNMYTLDYEMQEKVVASLDYSTSPGQLESYCLMWDLRPYVDERVLHHAWSFVSPRQPTS